MVLAVMGGIQVALLAGWAPQAGLHASVPTPAPVAVHGVPDACPGARCNPAVPNSGSGTEVLIAVAAVLGGAVVVLSAIRRRRRQVASPLAAGVAVLVARPPQAVSLAL